MSAFGGPTTRTNHYHSTVGFSCMDYAFVWRARRGGGGGGKTIDLTSDDSTKAEEETVVEEDDNVVPPPPPRDDTTARIIPSDIAHVPPRGGRLLVPTTKAHRSVRILGYHADRWAEMFEELRRFRERFGHCNVRTTDKEHFILGRWVKRQRYSYKQMIGGMACNMTRERQRRLESVGFVWDSQGATWTERLAELQEYRKASGGGGGDAALSTRNIKDKRLMKWVKVQRYQYKLLTKGKPSNMTPGRIRSLEALGFKWVCRKEKEDPLLY